MELPNNIFFTGVPGSKWSGIAQVLEGLPGFNRTDRAPHRVYKHNDYSGHIGAYFGVGMEFDANSSMTDQAYSDPSAGSKIIKSHEWAYKLDNIHTFQVIHKGDWIMLVYRPDAVSLAWWFQAGGFNITYPNYEVYKDATTMNIQIQIQNQSILEFGAKHKCTWSYFTSEWVLEHFGVEMDLLSPPTDVLVTLIKK